MTLILLFILTIMPLSLPSLSGMAAPGTPTESILSVNMTRNTASVDLNVASSSGTFAKSNSSEEASFSISTNNFTGYTLAISAPDDTGELLSNNSFLASISSSLSESAFDSSSHNGEWGYRPSIYNSSTNTNFLPSPTTSASVLDATSAPNSNANLYSIALGARADYSSAAGTYEKAFLITAISNPVNYVVRYDANSTDSSIQDIPNDQSGAASSSFIKLSSNVPTRSRYLFLGWCTVVPTLSGDSDTCVGTDAQVFQPGDDFGIDQTSTNTFLLYAMWESAGIACTKEYRLQNADGSYPSTYTQDSVEYVSRGSTCTFAKTITDYQGDTGNDTARSQSVANIAAPVTIQMDFPRNVYALTVDKNNYYISAITGAGDHRWGEDVAVSATLSIGEFIGWSQTSGTTGSFTDTTTTSTVFTMPKSAATIYADADFKVQKPGFISYHPNIVDPGDIEGNIGDQSISNGASVMLYVPNYKRDGYGFAGWNTSKDGSGTNYGPSQDFTAPSDATTSGVMLYANWIQSAGDLQNWSGCNDLASGSVTALTDTRDGNTYAVAKLADSKCWMIENIRIANKNSAGSDIILSTSNTHNPSTPLTNTDGTTSNHLSPTTNPTQTAWCTSNNSTCVDRSMLATNNTALFVNNSPASYSISSDVYGYGNYYNWYSATAGNGKYSTGNNTNVSGDICPTGWHLPTGRNANGDFVMLNTYLGTSTSATYRSYPNNFVYSGEVSGSSISNRSTTATYWTATSSNKGNVYYFSFTSSNVSAGTATAYKYYGRAVRCVIAP